MNVVYPLQVLAELKQSNFTLLNQSIQFDENIEPKFGSYSIVFWNDSGEAEVIGYYKFQPSIYYYINENKIQWYTDGEVSGYFYQIMCGIMQCAYRV